MQSDFKPQRPVNSLEVGSLEVGSLEASSLEKEFQSILERCYRPSSRLKSSRFERGLTQLLNFLLDFLTGKAEISIRQRQSLDGTMQWIVYDPDSNDRRVFYSEQAVRAWLEQRHLK